MDENELRAKAAELSCNVMGACISAMINKGMSVDTNIYHPLVLVPEIEAYIRMGARPEFKTPKGFKFLWR